MKKNPNTWPQPSRRKFIKTSTLGMGAFSLGVIGCSGSESSEKTAAGLDDSSKQTKKKKLGIALVGLGNYATNQLAPALLETEHCYLAGIVTGTKEKEKIWQEKYNIPSENIYNYDNYDTIAENEAIDIIYIVLPNSMHAEYSIRAAQAHKHVMCEKPMALSVDECQQMINACNEADVKLAIGYRLHYDPFNLEMMRLGQKQVYGKVTEMDAIFGFKMGNLDQWRAKKAMAGGGPLMDVGIYALQGSIYTLGELPVSLTAIETTLNKEDWPEVEGSLEWEMNFPSGLTATYKTSYEENYQYLKAKAERGFFELSPAYVYNDLAGITTDGPMVIQAVNQQAQHMDAFTRNVLDNTEIITPGEMGLRDVYIMNKIYESAANNGQRMELPDMPQVLQKI